MSLLSQLIRKNSIFCRHMGCIWNMKHELRLLINAFCESIGEAKSSYFPAFQAATGCDPISALGKIMHGRAVFCDCQLDTLEYLSVHQFKNLNLDSCYFKSLERLLIVAYDKIRFSARKISLYPRCFCLILVSVQCITLELDNQHQIPPSPVEFSWTKVSNI